MKLKTYLYQRKQDYLEIIVPQKQLLSQWEQLLPLLIARKKQRIIPFRLILSLIVFLLFISTTLFVQAQKAQPGQPLYPLKQITQQAQIALSGEQNTPNSATPIPQIKAEIKSEEATPTPINTQEIEATKAATPRPTHPSQQNESNHRFLNNRTSLGSLGSFQFENKGKKSEFNFSHKKEGIINDLTQHLHWNSQNKNEGQN
jgi:hypothetical protein